ncbi:MAG: hypothetical protein MZW92_63355 [Comamonadaceae bacterium]|nr:hypothetical protein [Comamonadaceae bacterium]
MTLAVAAHALGRDRLGRQVRLHLLRPAEPTTLEVTALAAGETLTESVTVQRDRARDRCAPATDVPRSASLAPPPRAS